MKETLQTAMEADIKDTEANEALTRVAREMATAMARHMLYEGGEADADIYMRQMYTTLKALTAAGLVVLPTDPPDEWWAAVLGPLMDEASPMRRAYRAMIAAVYGGGMP